MIASPVAPVPTSRLSLLAKVLIGYGVVGLIGAAIAAVLLVIAFSRVTTLSNQLTDNVGGVSAVLDKTATALDDAANSASSFATTLDAVSTATVNAATDLRQIVPRLRGLQEGANAVSILGSQPLGRLGQLFGEIADQVTNLTGELDTISKSLIGNRSALEKNATSLAGLADEVGTLSTTLAGDQLAVAIDSLRWLILALLAIAAIGAAVPAAGALIAGWWLRDMLQHQATPAI